MSVWHGNLKKRKPSGGRKRSFRTKRSFEHGSFPAETSLGDLKRKTERGRGGRYKVRILSGKYACVTDRKSGKTEKIEIVRVAGNQANVDYDRRGVITKGTIIETSKGMARVTSRPGQNGIINAVLVGREETG